MRITALLLVFFSLSVLAEGKTYKLKENISITIIEKPFNESEWDITYCEKSKHICLINGKRPYGFESAKPKHYMHSLIATVEGVKFTLDSSNMFNAWGDRPHEYPGTVKYFDGVCQTKNWCTFRGLFSDGAGSFVAEWQIRQGIPERTIITTSSDVVHLFIKSISPSVYY